MTDPVKTHDGATRTFQRFTLSNPEFAANSKAWRISRKASSTRLKVARGASVLGNLVWTDLPGALTKGSAYQLTIDWTPQTDTPTVNFHVRNPDTGSFRVVGRVDVSQGSSGPRQDTITFPVSDPGFSQVMLGAVHFTGRRAGAEVRSIALQEIPAAVAAASRPRGSGSSPAQRFAKEAMALALADHERQVRSFQRAHASSKVSGARARMIFHAHAIEKGLSRSNFRAGFGKIAVPGLAKEMNAWLASGYSTEDPFLESSAAVMKSYFARHAAMKADVSDFRRLFSEASQDLIDNTPHQEGGVLPAGQTREIYRETDDRRSFLDVVYGRRSVREYTHEPVSDADINRAVQIAMQAPSVCNRQGARVHQFEDPHIIKSVLDIQGGFHGYEMPPRLLLITADLDAFLFAPERHQPFVDGGLFMMSLLLGLTQVGLGSCSLNTAMGSKKEAAIRNIIDIPDNEVFISFVAVGHYDREVLVPRSKRTHVEDVLVRHTKG